MASPAFSLMGSAALSASATSLSPANPTRSNGNKLICVTCSKNNAVHSYAAGWNIVGQYNSGANFTMSIAECTVTGSEVAPAPSWTGAVACRSIVGVWTGEDTEVVGSGSNSNNSGSGATHSVSAVNTTRNDSRVLVFDGVAVNTALSTPSGWTMDSRSGDATSGINIGIGGKNVATSGTSSGAISVSGGNSDWAMVLVELRSPASGSLYTQNERGIRGLNRGIAAGAV